MASSLCTRRRITKSLVFVVFAVCFIAGCFKEQKNEITGAGDPLFTLSGRIFDVDNDRPVGGALVEIKALNLKTNADSSGVYTFSGLKVGTRNLEVSAPNYARIRLSVTFQFENRDVKTDIALTKALTIAQQIALPFENPSGIWWENDQVLIASFDTAGGNIYRLDENFNVLQISPHIGTLKADTCFLRLRTCFWKGDSCFAGIDPDNPFTPDSITVDSAFVNCDQRLYGLVRIAGHYYTTDGIGRFYEISILDNPFISLGVPHLFRLDPVTLDTVEVLELRDAFEVSQLSLLTDLAWDSQAIWQSNYFLNTLPKIRGETFSAQAIHASPVSKPLGLAWDGNYLWLTSGNRLLQLYRDATIRNRYVLADWTTGETLDQIAWDGETIWAVRTHARRVYKLSIPFKDHL